MKHRADTVALDDGARGVGRAPGKHVAPVEDDVLGPSPEGVLDTALWRGRHLGRWLLVVAAFAALAITVPEVVTYWRAQSVDNLQQLMVVVTFAIGLWSILASCPPRQVRLDGSMLGVRGQGLDEVFDLADALQRVELSGRPDKRDWKLSFGRPDRPDVVLTRRDVDAVALDVVVRHHRALAERRRHHEWARLGIAEIC